MKIIPGSALSALLLAASSTADADRDKRELAVDKVKGNLSVMVLGSGGPVATSSGRASAGYLIFTDGKPRILMDVGGGTFARIAESGIDLKDLDIVLLTHLHIDHTADMSAVVKTIYFHNRRAGSKRSATDSPIHFYGPSRLPETIPGSQAYSASTEYVDGHYHKAEGLERYIHGFAGAIEAGEFGYTANDIPAVFTTPMGAPPVHTVLNSDDGLKVEAIGVNHGPVPNVAYRIEYKGKSIVYSGDTTSKTNNMITLASHADILIYDTAIMDDEPALDSVFHKLHTNPTRLGQVAAASQPKTLILSHITPVTEPRLKEVKRIVKNEGYEGKIKVAKDLKVFNMKD